jgi:hypothetical protein
MMALMAGWLLFTVPSFSAYSDDTTATCEAWQPTQDLAWVRLYGYPVTGGGWRLVDSVDVRGMEGQEDSIAAPWDGHFSVQPVDTAGNAGCWSEVAYIGPITGVTPGDGWPNPPRMLSMRWYDIQGKRIDWPPATSCVYWQVTNWSDGTRKVRKLVHLK